MRAHRVNEMLNMSAPNKAYCSKFIFAILTLALGTDWEVGCSRTYIWKPEVFELADGDPLSQRLKQGAKSGREAIKPQKQ